MQQQRLLLCATDAGGISVLLPVAEFLEKAGGISWLFATEPRYAERIARIAGERLSVVDPAPSAQAAVKLLEQVRPDAVLCGTTRYESIDRVLIHEARLRNIPTVVVLDEWSNYRRRFENSNRELVYLPDRIAIMDETARQEALADGLPDGVLEVTGHPALTKMWENISRGDRQERPALLAQYPGHQVITFLSEELRSNFIGDGSMGEPLGFDEVIVLRDIIDEARTFHRPVLIVNKLHPSSDTDETVQLIGDTVVVATAKAINLHALLQHSDMAIGMISVALIEAAMIGTPIASYQPNARVQGLSTAVRLGLAPLLADRKALGEWMKAPPAPARTNPDFVRAESVQAIIDLALPTERNRGSHDVSAASSRAGATEE